MESIVDKNIRHFCSATFTRSTYFELWWINKNFKIGKNKKLQWGSNSDPFEFQPNVFPTALSHQLISNGFLLVCRECFFTFFDFDIMDNSLIMFFVFLTFLLDNNGQNAKILQFYKVKKIYASNSSSNHHGVCWFHWWFHPGCVDFLFQLWNQHIP